MLSSKHVGRSNPRSRSQTGRSWERPEGNNSKAVRVANIFIERLLYMHLGPFLVCVIEMGKSQNGGGKNGSSRPKKRFWGPQRDNPNSEANPYANWNSVIPHLDMEWSSTPKSLLCLQARLPLHNRAASELGAFPYIKLEGIKLRMGSPPNLGCSDSRWKRPWRCIHSLTWLFTWGRWGSTHVYNLSSSCGCPQTWYIIIFSGYHKHLDLTVWDQVLWHFRPMRRFLKFTRAQRVAFPMGSYGSPTLKMTVSLVYYGIVFHDCVWGLCMKSKSDSSGVRRRSLLFFWGFGGLFATSILSDVLSQWSKWRKRYRGEFLGRTGFCFSMIPTW